ncbi:MAG: hypothetical protein JXB48_17370 [Candidatus Latescibacteria bacterium]|nr:hypothetical protein [Candidatus Latescibacterota bacterium]
MRVIADTCVWFQVLQYKNPDVEIATTLKDLINDGRIVLIGPIRQELLSGILYKRQFDILKEYLDAFADIPLRIEHFVTAA